MSKANTKPKSLRAQVLDVFKLNPNSWFNAETLKTVFDSGTNAQYRDACYVLSQLGWLVRSDTPHAFYKLA